MSNLKQINLNIPVLLHEKLKEYKERSGIDISNYIRTAIVNQAKEDKIL